MKFGIIFVMHIIKPTVKPIHSAEVTELEPRIKPNPTAATKNSFIASQTVEIALNYCIVLKNN